MDGIGMYTFSANATNLPKKDLFGKSDPYLVFRIPIDVTGEKKIKNKEKALKRGFEVGATVGEVALGVTATTAIALATGVIAVMIPVAVGVLGAYAIKRATKLHPPLENFNEIFVSEVIKRTLNPTWTPFNLGFHNNFKNNTSAQMLVECYDWNRAQKSKFIGSCWIVLPSLLTSNKQLEFKLLDRKNRPAGELFLLCTPHPSLSLTSSSSSPFLALSPSPSPSLPSPVSSKSSPSLSISIGSLRSSVSTSSSSTSSTSSFPSPAWVPGTPTK